MNESMFNHNAVEPERYELVSGPVYHFELVRRQFFRLLGGGVAVVLWLKDAFAIQESGGGGRRENGFPEEIGAWLHIGEDGKIAVYTGKVEVGQNIRTSLSQVVAEELQVPLESIRMVMGDTDLTPYDSGTFGSLTTRVMAPQLRKVATAAREALIDLAAAKLKAEHGEFAIIGGRVQHLRTKQTFSFGELTRGQKLIKPVGSGAAAVPPTQWKTAGQSAPKVNGRDFVTGKHRYSSDLKLSGMLYGKILRSPAFGSRLITFDPSKAEAANGVTVVRDGNFIGVAAPSEEIALRAVNLLAAKWESAPQPSGKDLFDTLKKNAAQNHSRAEEEFLLGSIQEGLAAADKKLEQRYTVSYIAHAPLEPRAAVATWENGKLTVWTGTQRPFGVRSELAEAFRLPEDHIRVIVPDTGSGYGGKHTGEAAIEAARLAKAAGKPVKLVWTREEEFTWAYFRPAGVIAVRSGVKHDGILTAWEFHNYNSGASSIRPLYEIPHQKIQFHPADSPLRQGSYRALAATANHFARESHMDELAHSLKMDALEFRLRNLKDPRLRAVLEAAARQFEWEKKKSTSERGYGLAGGFEKGSYVTTCAEVAVDREHDEVKVVHVVTAFECGAVLNPDQLKNQIEGAIVMGIGGALFEAIEYEEGMIQNPRFSRYRVPRFSDVPRMETVLLNRKELPSVGAGETPIVAIAPAIANAIFAATGVRLTSLPLAPKGIPRRHG